MSALSQMLTLPGTGAVNAAQAGQSGLATTAGGMYNQYMPQVMSGLQGLYTPGSPLFQQLNTQAAGGAQQLQAQLDSRGLGNSSFAGNDLSGYYAGIQNQRANLALQGLTQMGGLAQGAGGLAQGAWGNVGQMGQGQQQVYGQALAGLGAAAAGMPWGAMGSGLMGMFGGGAIAGGNMMSGNAIPNGMA